MGRQIVYCEACGNSLREDDFERGRARIIDKLPFCTECRPFTEGESGSPNRRSSSGKVPAPAASPRKTSTGHIPILNPPPRRPRTVQSANPLPILAGLGGLAFIALIYVVTQGGSKPPPVAVAPPPAPLIELPPPRPRIDPPPPPDPTPPPPRREPPAARSQGSSDPLVAPSAAEKFEAFLAQIRQMIQNDVQRERTEEVLAMFAAALQNAGPRVAEVERMKADYVSTLDEPGRLAAAWSDWKVLSSSEPGHTALLPSYSGRANVYMTHPIDATTAARMDRDVNIPAGKKTRLSFWVMAAPAESFELRVIADGKKLLQETVGPPAAGWVQKSVDLTEFAGKRVALRLENGPRTASGERAYWCDVTLTSE